MLNSAGVQRHPPSWNRWNTSSCSTTARRRTPPRWAWPAIHERWWPPARRSLISPTLTNTPAPPPLHHRHHRPPKGCFSAIANWCCNILSAALGQASNEHGRLHREDVYMPITLMFHVTPRGVQISPPWLGIRQVYPGRYLPESLLNLIAQEKSPSRSACPPFCTCRSPTRAPRMLI